MIRKLKPKQIIRVKNRGEVACVRMAASRNNRIVKQLKSGNQIIMWCVK